MTHEHEVEADTIGRATYSPEDNKLRIYPEGVRVDSVLTEAEYSAFKSAGYKWAAKQECFVCPRWTPTAEDWALRLCGEIGDEDYSATERAADRAERFSGYREKRADEAGGLADTYDAGPQAFGHQSRDRAERQARRHDRTRAHALNRWSKAEYWQARTEGVIAHALHRADPATRRGRIKTLETEQRKELKSWDEYAERFALWMKVPTLEGPDVPVIRNDDGYGIDPATSPAGQLAYRLANYGCYGNYRHPRTGRDSSLYSLLTDAVDPITPAEASELWRGGRDTLTMSAGRSRWMSHYELRLNYERAMLANEGGTAADADMVVGGWVGSHQIHKVNKSNTTGKVVSVTLRLPGDRWGNTKEGHHMRAFNIERLPEGAYRAPTDEERAAFEAETKQRKAAEKAKATKTPPLINPTDADAERLQAIWNAARPKQEPQSVLRMTQAEYSARSKGSYSSYETIEISERAERIRPSLYGRSDDQCLSVVVFKIRRGPSSGLYAADRVIVITDKPQKPIPWEAMDDARDALPSEETLTEELPAIAAICGKSWFWDLTAEDVALFDKARYVGWAQYASQSQFGLTEAGREALKRFEQSGKPEPIAAGQLF